MILPFRIALFVLAVSLTYFFGGTTERILLEVVRAFIALDASNALAFNLAHLAVSILPLLLLGAALSVGFGGEADLKRRLWRMVLGALFGIAVYRAYQVWWVFRGGIGDDLNSWTETLSLSQLFFFEKVFPFLLLGSSVSIVPAFARRGLGEKFLDAASALGFTAFWLAATHKIQTVTEISHALAAACSAALACALIVALSQALFSD